LNGIFGDGNQLEIFSLKISKSPEFEGIDAAPIMHLSPNCLKNLKVAMEQSHLVTLHPSGNMQRSLLSRNRA